MNTTPIATKLILLEGPPGSGKTTTARKIAEWLDDGGFACQCFYEWSPDHPIPIGDDLHLGEVIRSSIDREGEVLQMWKRFSTDAETKDRITVMESRFWQTSLMLMYAAGSPLNSILESNRRVVNAIRALNPVLIYFAVDPLREFVQRTIQIKEAEWQAGQIPGTWAGHIFSAFEGLPWFQQRGLAGQEGFIQFLEDWFTVSNELFAQFPCRKLEIHNPHHDWSASMGTIQHFLENL